MGTLMVKCDQCARVWRAPLQADAIRCAACGATSMVNLGVNAVSEGGAPDLRSINQGMGHALDPARVRRDISTKFDDALLGASRDEFYAGWAAYDAVLESMPPKQRELQRKAEILALEVMGAL